jgi:hypothetical protein
MMIILAILTKIKNFIFKYWKQLLLVSLGAFLMLKAQGCAKKLFPPKTPISGPSSPIAKQPVLPKDDKEIITTNSIEGTTTVTNSQGSTTVTGTRGTTIEIKKDGTVKVTEKTVGFCHNIVLGAAVNNTGPKGTLGLEWFFYKRLDVISGLGADKYISHTAGFTSIGYTPINKVFHGNTSFWIGGSIDTTGTKSVITGFSVRI